MNEASIAIIYDNTIRPDTTGIYFKKGLEEMEGVSIDHYNSKSYLDDSIQDKYDLYLCIDDGFDKNKPIRIYKSGVTAFYAIDTHLTFKSKVLKAKLYDFVFCAQRDAVKKMRSIGINAFWVPLGFDEILHRKQAVEKIYDLAFIGNINISAARRKLVKRYKDKYKTFIGKAPNSEISKIYSQSKIVINLPIKNDINMRFFEAIGSGSLLLSKKVNNGEDEIVQDKIHYVNFYNWWDLDRKIAYYLSHDEAREKIANAGYNLAINNFTYKKRIELMLDIINFHIIDKKI